MNVIHSRDLQQDDLFAKDERKINSFDELISLVAKNGLDLFKGSYFLRKNKQIVLTAVTQNGQAIKSAAQELRKDQDVGLAAMKCDEDAWRYLDDTLRKSIDFNILLIEEIGWTLNMMNPVVCNTEKVAMHAVRKDGFAIQHLDQMTIKNMDIVSEALRENGLALQFVSHYKDDEEMVFIAKNQNKEALKFASARLKEKYGFYKK